MATLALAKNFLDEFAKLDHQLQKRVRTSIDLFYQLSVAELYAHKGLHLEPHTGAADPQARTIRFDLNHRGIVMDTGKNDTFILMSVGTHDTTDRWMAKNTFKVNAGTGAFEVIDVEAVEAAGANILAQRPEPAADPLFAHRKDKDFTQLGIDADLVIALRALTNQDQLAGLLGVLPLGQAEALIGLTGDDSIESIYAHITGLETKAPVEVDTSNVVAALETPASQASFRLVAGQEELRAILNEPLAQWRIYLHPSQSRMANRPRYNGPARVTGGAGTGKTVVAIHRAARLAANLDDRSGKPILFTTFTRNLADAIEQDLRQLGGSDLLDVVEVRNVDRLSYRIVQEAEGGTPRLANNSEVQGMWERIVDERGLDYSPSFLNNEWEQVILAQDLRSQAAYFSASRAGRGVALDRRKRAVVWKAVEAFTKRLAEKGSRTYLQLAEAAAGHLARRSVKLYRHVVVDEAQDLHESQWRLLRAMVDEGPNDLFIVGDSHQRIYDRRSSLSKVGINIRGRSTKLKINYRTTHETLGWSLAVLGEADFDDLDTGSDQHDFAGYHSYRHGVLPTLSGHPSKKAQIDALVAQVQDWVRQGVDEEAIGIAARARSSFDVVERALSDAGRQVCVLPTELPRAAGVRIGTMHRMKGLEFERVAIIDADDRTLPAAAALTDASDDPSQRAVDLQRELCLLYVAATRARDELWVGWSGKPSRFLGPVLPEEST